MLLKDNPEYPPLYGEGNYLKAHEAQGYALAIQRLFGDAGLRKDLSARSVEVASHFSVTKYADTLVGLYQELMAKTR